VEEALVLQQGLEGESPTLSLSRAQTAPLTAYQLRTAYRGPLFTLLDFLHLGDADRRHDFVPFARIRALPAPLRDPAFEALQTASPQCAQFRSASGGLTRITEKERALFLWEGVVDQIRRRVWN